MASQESYFEQIQTFIPDFKKENKEISSKSVGWHLDHSLRVIQGISSDLAIIKEKSYKKSNSMGKAYVFFTGKIPRGKGRAPKRVVSETNEFSMEELEALLVSAKSQYKNLEKIPEGNYFSHPLFGDLRKKKAMRFIAIHTNHHLKIIQDIIAK